MSAHPWLADAVLFLESLAACESAARVAHSKTPSVGDVLYRCSCEMVYAGALAMSDSAPPPILLFDGVCNFCAWSVRFIIERDSGQLFRFASLQSDTGRRLLSEHGLNPDAIDSVVLLEDSKAWRESDAALRVCRHLRAPWNCFWPLRFLPRFFRDAVYRFIARNRYRWFGKMESCMLPTPEMRARFLD